MRLRSFGAEDLGRALPAALQRGRSANPLYPAGDLLRAARVHWPFAPDLPKVLATGRELVATVEPNLRTPRATSHTGSKGGQLDNVNPPLAGLALGNVGLGRSEAARNLNLRQSRF